MSLAGPCAHRTATTQGCATSPTPGPLCTVCRAASAHGVRSASCLRRSLSVMRANMFEVESAVRSEMRAELQHEREARS